MSEANVGSTPVSNAFNTLNLPLSREPVERTGDSPITGSMGAGRTPFTRLTMREVASGAPVPTAGALWGASC